jgi:hypothetical protein
MDSLGMFNNEGAVINNQPHRAVENTQIKEEEKT